MARFEIDAANGALSFKELPDYESRRPREQPREGLQRHRAGYRAVDDGDPQTDELTGRLAVTVAVTDINEPPTITGERGAQR